MHRPLMLNAWKGEKKQPASSQHTKAPLEIV